MEGDGNGIRTLWRKLKFMLIPTSRGRTKFINKNKHLFHHIGEGLFFQPRKFPTDPEYISIGNNVWIASEVAFVNHDIINDMLNVYDSTLNLKGLWGPIEIGDNVMIGARVMIMPNVRIGNNVIIAAGSIVSKDIPDNSVAGGIPAKPIGKFNELIEKRKASLASYNCEIEKIWENFYHQRNN